MILKFSQIIEVQINKKIKIGMDLPPCNFRTVFPDSTITKSNLFRSNAIDDGTIKSAQWLRETMRINAYIDFREESEFCPNSKLDDYFIRIDKNTNMTNISENYGRRYHVRFITLSYHIKLLIYKLKLKQVFFLLLLLIQHFFTKNYKYQKYGGQCYFETMSLGDFYSELLDDCQTVFKQIFLIMTDRNNFPMVICCSFGKDRTGIVAALLMKLVGYDDEVVIDEYCKSESNLISIKEDIIKFFEFKGARKEFCGTPRNAIITMLSHIKRRYGDTESYLKCCGITTDQIEKIKSNVLINNK